MSATAFRGKDFSTLDETDDHTSVSAPLTDEDSSFPPHLTEDVINVGGWTVVWIRGHKTEQVKFKVKRHVYPNNSLSYLNEAGVRLHGWQLPSPEPNCHPIFQPTSLTELLVLWEFSRIVLIQIIVML